MMTINIDPVACILGHFAVPWYAVTLVTAVATTIVMTWWEARRVGIALKNFCLVATWAVIGGVIAAKIVHVIDWWEHYAAHPREILRPEGWALYGAILGAILAVLVNARISGTSFWQWGDVAAPGAALGQAIGRIGCLIQGCCYGVPTSLPWAVVYTHSRNHAPLGVALHPVQAYFLLLNLAVFATIWQLRRRLKPAGSLFLVYLTLYSAGDFSLRFLRQGEPFLVHLQQAQVMGLAVLAVAAPLLLVRAHFFSGKGCT